MKNVYILTALLLLGFGMQSFTSNDKDEHKYSHDDRINDFIIENMDFVVSMSRETAVTYKLSTTKSIYRTWSEYKRMKVWQDKLKQDAELFDGEQKELILNATQENPNEEEVIKSFGKPLAASIFANLKTLKEQGYDRSKLLAMNNPNFPNTKPQPEGGGGGSGAGETEGEHGGWGNGGNPTGEGERSGSSSGHVPESDDGKCECSIQSDFCAGTTCAGPSGCEEVYQDCGWFWNHNCDGQC